MMKIKFTILFICSLVLIQCSNHKDSKYLRWVGDILYDENLDDKHDHLCNGEEYVLQYFNIGQGLAFKGEKKAIVDFFNKHYQNVEVEESGWIRIRFIVNCKGETDRYRMLQADRNYKAFEFDAKITDQLMDLCKRLEGWQVLPDNEHPKDYYQYLSFKIDRGRIIEILP